MKKVISLSLALLLLFPATFAFAAECPLPEANTNKEINFSGFEWYSDYSETLAAATAKGIINVRDYFDEDSYLTPHWTSFYWGKYGRDDAGSEKNCGGYISSSSGIPNVAGYKVNNLYLYMMWNPTDGKVNDYKATGAAQFYMAEYSFEVTDKEACYNDLISKLKGLYGENPIEQVAGNSSKTYYTTWVNNEGAMICLAYNENYVKLEYMAPGAEEKLCEVEECVRQQEIALAAGDISGL